METLLLSTALHAGRDPEFWVDQSEFTRQEILFCTEAACYKQERHWSQALFLTDDGIKYLRKGIYSIEASTLAFWALSLEPRRSQATISINVIVM